MRWRSDQPSARRHRRSLCQEQAPQQGRRQVGRVQFEGIL